jgi:hypothetical protein
MDDHIAIHKHKKIAIIVISIFAIVLVLLYIGCYYRELNEITQTSYEGFANKKEKAVAITDWFNRTSDPKYTDYKKAMSGQSNVVEYEDALGLYKNRNLTVTSIENMI